jgi:hypothetical protein
MLAQHVQKSVDRNVIRFFALKDVNPGDIHAELLSVYGADALFLQTVYQWYHRFVEG